MKKILIIDDHPLIRKGLAITIESEPNLKFVVRPQRQKKD